MKEENQFANVELNEETMQKMIAQLVIKNARLKDKIEKALKFMNDKDIVFSFTNVRILREILEGTEEVGEDGEYI